jgi:tRNA(adenine34) deaminase
MTADVDQAYMQQALALASHAAELGEVPVGALIVQQGVVIGRGWNQPISGHDPTAHAEIMAIRDAAATISNYRLVDATLYVTIEPCSMCAGAIVHARLSRLVFGASEPKAGVAASNGCFFDGPHLNHKIALTGGVMAEECSATISQFFQARRQAKKTERINRSV